MKKPKGIEKQRYETTGVGPSFNALASPWMEVVDLEGKFRRISPLDAITDATTIHRIVAESPLDVFAAHRFLLTLLYWFTDDAKGVAALRRSLLQGTVQPRIITFLKGEAERFDLFDRKTPFLQDPAVIKAKKSTPAYLFAEMAAGTNVAHFHHGTDGTTRLCVRCAVIGLLRLVPWSQAGGAGKTPAIHGAPPIMPLAMGDTLCETLGLNLIPTEIPQGEPKWTGHFRPSSSRVKLMEGLTWNPRRVHLLEPHEPSTCSRCGGASLPTVGPIVFEKNEACKKDEKRVWRDPAAFYSLKNGVPFNTVKSGKESFAATGGDLRNLFERTYGKKVEPAPASLVVEANPAHSAWYVVIPCTNPANNKSYDHRAVWMSAFGGAPPKAEFGWPKDVVVEAGDPRPPKEGRRVTPSIGAVAFVRAASALDAAAWTTVGNARSMEDDPAAFDVFTGVYWPLRQRHPSLPSRPAAWLALKLMADSGAYRPSRKPVGVSPFRPWSQIVSHQPDAKTSDGRVKRYPRALPSGDQLECELRQIIRRFISSRPASNIDWPGTCQFLHDVLS